MATPPSGSVSPLEDLRRAVAWNQRDDEGHPTSAAFASVNISIDVAGLAPLIESRQRFPEKWLAILPCSAAIEAGVPPQHDPLPENVSHAIIPGKPTRGQSRKLKAAITSIIDPLIAR